MDACSQEMLVHIAFVEIPCYSDTIVCKAALNDVDIGGRQAGGEVELDSIPHVHDSSCIA